MLPWWPGLDAVEKIIVSLIISVIIGILLEPIMSSLGLYIAKRPSLVPKGILKILESDKIEAVSDLMLKGIWIVIDESEKELLWRTTTMYYMYASCSLILFISFWIHLVRFVLYVVQLISISSNNAIASGLICALSLILFFTCNYQVSVYLKIMGHYMNYIRKKYPAEIGNLE